MYHVPVRGNTYPSVSAARLTLYLSEFCSEYVHHVGLDVLGQVRQELDVHGFRSAPLYQHHRLQLSGVVDRQHGSHRRRRHFGGYLHLKPP